MATLHRPQQQTPSGPSDSLTIGSTVLLDEETPDELIIEIKRVWAIVTYIGGARVAQDMGPSPADITWKGRLFAGNVAERFAALQSMENAAQLVPLTYLDQAFNVVIKTVRKVYEHRWQGGYEITVTIIEDVSGQYQVGSGPSAEQQVDALWQRALDTLEQLVQADPFETPGIQTEFTILFAALELAGMLSELTSGSLQNLVTLAGQAAGAAAAYIANHGGANGSSQLFLLASDLETSALLIAKNLQSGNAPNVVVIHGADQSDLFGLAAQAYGDASLAFALASINGLSSPLLASTKVYTLTLPTTLVA